MTLSFHSWPNFSHEEADAVSKVILSNKVNYWTGNECRLFEEEFASFAETKYAVALANGTVALDVALHALNIGLHNGGQKSDEVIVTPRTFLASVSCVVNAGAVPVFADVDSMTQNIESHTIEKVLSPNTKAVIVVHLAGMPADMQPILELAKCHSIYVIEDCAQAHGARYRGQSVGSIGDIGCWSFCQDKIMTTGGEGGMVTTNDETIWKKIWAFKDHGKSWDAVYNKQHKPGFRWVHDSFGSNFRLTEMQSAIGRIQLKKMPEWIVSRQRNASKIDGIAAKFRVVRTVLIPDYIQHAEYKHYLFVNEEYLADGWTRDRIIEEIVQLGVPCYQGSCSEVYLEKAFEKTNFIPEIRLKNAKLLGETSLMFLVHPTLTQEDINNTCDVISKVLSLASAE